jgi:hypothetical protein
MNPAITEFIRSKITEAQKAIAAREQMVAMFSTGSDESWAEAAKLHPSTAGRPMSKAGRAREVAVHDRIATRLRCELKMFESISQALADIPHLKAIEAAAVSVLAGHASGSAVVLQGAINRLVETLQPEGKDAR